MVNNVETSPKFSKEAEAVFQHVVELLDSNGVPMSVFLKALDEHFDEIFTGC